MDKSPEEKRGRGAALLAYFILGLDATIVQALLIRAFLVAYQGNELCVGIVFGAWFLWVMAGARTGAWVAARIRRKSLVFYASLAAGILCVAGQLILVQLARSVLSIPAGLQIPIRTIAWFTPLVMFPFPFVVGSAFPIGTGFFGVREHDARAIGLAYVAEALGALCGGVVFTLAFAGKVPPFTIISLMLLATCVLGLAAIWTRAIGSRRVRVAGIIVCVLVAGLLRPVMKLEGASSRLLWKSLESPGEFIDSRRTRFQHVILAKAHGQYNVYSNGNYIASFPNPWEDAIEANYILSEHPNPRSVLVIGEMIAGLAARALETPNVARLRRAR